MVDLAALQRENQSLRDQLAASQQEAKERDSAGGGGGSVVRDPQRSHPPDDVSSSSAYRGLLPQHQPMLYSSLPSLPKLESVVLAAGAADYDDDDDDDDDDAAAPVARKTTAAAAAAATLPPLMGGGDGQRSLSDVDAEMRDEFERYMKLVRDDTVFVADVLDEIEEIRGTRDDTLSRFTRSVTSMLGLQKAGRRFLTLSRSGNKKMRSEEKCKGFLLLSDNDEKWWMTRQRLQAQGSVAQSHIEQGEQRLRKAGEEADSSRGSHALHELLAHQAADHKTLEETDLQYRKMFDKYQEIQRLLAGRLSDIITGAAPQLPPAAAAAAAPAALPPLKKQPGTQQPSVAAEGVLSAKGSGGGGGGCAATPANGLPLVSSVQALSAPTPCTFLSSQPRPLRAPKVRPLPKPIPLPLRTQVCQKAAPAPQV